MRQPHGSHPVQAVIDEARRNAIANAVVKRIAMLKEIAERHTSTDNLSDDLTENIAQTY